MRPAAIDPPEIHSQLWVGFHGTVGWDIGANCGQTMREMTTRFTQVVVFEPAAECMPYLQPWAARANVVVKQLAVSDTDADIDLVVLPDKIDTGQLVTAGTVGMEWNPDTPAAGTRRVPAARIDTLVAQLPPPDFCKIDVEGHELKVLTGARQTLTAHRPDLLIEFHSRELYTQVTRRLARHGYPRVDTVRHPHYTPDSDLWHTHGWIRAFARSDR